MDCILKEFEPYHLLLRQEGREYFKTGTLYGINTRAGYYSDMNSNLYRYVVMLNTPGKSTRKIMDRLLQILDKKFL
jgi:D-alanyl-D-alanine carboxypeptidase/D-alanyl-D-alanine-endopeptidase (penicillin-binding protein 4)